MFVFLRRFGVAAWVVVGEDKAGGVLEKQVLDYLPGIDNRAIDCALADGGRPNYPVLDVEHDDGALFTRRPRKQVPSNLGADLTDYYKLVVFHTELNRLARGGSETPVVDNSYEPHVVADLVNPLQVPGRVIEEVSVCRKQRRTA